MKSKLHCFVVSFATVLSACGSSEGVKIGNTAAPLPTTFQFSGKILLPTGSPLANKVVYFQNPKFFGDLDATSPQISSDLGKNIFASLMFLAFPFVIYYDSSLNSGSFKTDKAGRFNSGIKTDSAGAFSLTLERSKLLTDLNAKANIVLVNEEASTPLFGKWVVQVDPSATVTAPELGTLTLCDLGGIAVTEGASTVNFSWTAPSDTVAKMVLKFVLSTNNTLLWAAEASAGATSLDVPKSVFEKNTVRVVGEAYYSNDATYKKMCMSAPKSFKLASPTSNISRDAKALIGNLKSTISTLSNGRFDDPSLFNAFDPNKIVFDLGSDKSFSKIHLYNLLHSGDSAGTVTVTGSSDGESFSSIASVAASRFLTIDLSSAATARFVAFSFSGNVKNLQEVSFYE